MTDRADGSDRTHVVMIVSNDIANDSRVRKEAAAVARTGLRVTLVGLASPSTPEHSWMGDVEIIRVPVPTRIKAARAVRRERRRARKMPLLGWPSKEERVARSLELRFEELEVQAASGLSLARLRQGKTSPVVYRLGVAGRRARQATIRLQRLTYKVRTRLDSWAGRAVAAGDRQLASRRELASWRRILPEQMDRELAFGPVLDRLQPDIIHAHDVDMLGVASRAVGRAALRGRQVRCIYDAHEYVHGLATSLARSERIIAAWAAYEDRYIRGADRVITVGPALREAIQRRYRLDRPPAVVLNTPVIDPPDPALPSLREVAGVAADVPLMVYAGAVTPARGLVTAIESLQHLPDVHLAMVCVPHSRTWYVRQLGLKAEAEGVGDRLHLVDPVAPGQVVRFLEEADIGIFSGLRYPSHDMALANKLFDYIFAGLPLVLSDLRAQSELVHEHGLGRVFTTGDPVDMARAVREVLADLPAIRERVADPAVREQFSWPRQEEIIRDVYRDLLERDLPWTHEVDPLVRSMTEVPVSPT